MADSTTTLSTNVGTGDKMDESLVTQGDLVTQAKRPRVVLAGDRGADADGVVDVVQPVSEDPGASPFAVPALAIAVVKETPNTFLEGELRGLSLTTEGRLRVATQPAVTYMDLFGGEGNPSTDPDDFKFLPSTNPFGF